MLALRALTPRFCPVVLSTWPRLFGSLSGCDDRIGLLSAVVASQELDSFVENLLQHLLAGGPEAMKKIKDLVRTVSGAHVDDALVGETAKRIAEIRVSPEGKEGITSFLEKRKPAWWRGK